MERYRGGAEKEKLEQEREKAFKKMATWGMVAVLGTIFTCAVSPIFVGAAIPSYVFFVKYYSQEEQLEKSINS